MSDALSASYGVLEIAPPTYYGDWQTNDVDLDIWYGIQNELERIRKASRLGLLDYYLDRADILKKSFKRFLLDLAAVKAKSDIPFELVKESSVPEALVDREIEDCLRYTPWIEDTEEDIRAAFKTLADSNPPRN